MYRWLKRLFRAEREPVGLRAHRDLILAAGADTARERTIRAIRDVLGANVYADDPRSGTIDAGFGLVNQERIHVALEALSETRTRIVIEARYAATLKRAVRSRAVDALADALESGVGT